MNRFLILALALLTSLQLVAGCGSSTSGSETGSNRGPAHKSKGAGGGERKQHAGGDTLSVTDATTVVYSADNGNGVWAQSPYGSEVIIVRMPGSSRSAQLQSRPPGETNFSAGAGCDIRDCFDRAKAGFDVTAFKLWQNGQVVGS